MVRKNLLYVNKKELFRRILFEKSELHKLLNDTPKSRGVIVADIDNTLLVPDPTVIGIYKTKNGKTEWLNCYEYDHDPDLLNENPNVQWDFSEFETPDKVRDSILQGTPLLKNLKFIDKYIQRGYDFAFLTARGCEDVVKEALKKFLKYRDEIGNLNQLGEIFKNGFSVAVSDNRYIQVFEGLNAAQRKGRILEYLCDKYDIVYFVEDSEKNIQAAKALNLPNLKLIQVT